MAVAALRDAGLVHQLDALDGLAGRGALTGPDPDRRPLGVLVAARSAARAPAPARGPVARAPRGGDAELDGAPVAVLAVHAPISQRAHGVKVRALEAVHAWLAAPPAPRAVLLGDLNTPRREHADGTS